jgi:mevalonate pyrophosphate decarboxylase
MTDKSEDYMRGYKNGAMRAHVVVYNHLEAAIKAEESDAVIDALRQAAQAVLEVSNRQSLEAEAADPE